MKGKGGPASPRHSGASNSPVVRAGALRRGAWPPVQPRVSEPGRRPSRNAWSTSPRPEGWRGTTAGVVPATARTAWADGQPSTVSGGVPTACRYVGLRATAARSCFVIAPGRLVRERVQTHADGDVRTGRTPQCNVPLEHRSLATPLGDAASWSGGERDGATLYYVEPPILENVYSSQWECYILRSKV